MDLNGVALNKKKKVYHNNETTSKINEPRTVKIYI